MSSATIERVETPRTVCERLPVTLLVRDAVDHLRSMVQRDRDTGEFVGRGVMEKTGFAFEREIVYAGLPHVLYRLLAPRS